jgi:hypothetical protein
MCAAAPCAAGSSRVMSESVSAGFYSPIGSGCPTADRDLSRPAGIGGGPIHPLAGALSSQAR